MRTVRLQKPWYVTWYRTYALLHICHKVVELVFTNHMKIKEEKKSSPTNATTAFVTCFCRILTANCPGPTRSFIPIKFTICLFCVGYTVSNRSVFIAYEGVVFVFSGRCTIYSGVTNWNRSGVLDQLSVQFTVYEKSTRRILCSPVSFLKISELPSDQNIHVWYHFWPRQIRAIKQTRILCWGT